MIGKMNRSQGRKKNILLVAADLIRKKSFLNTSLEDIAKKLKINKATIFYYYKNKEHLLFEIMFTAINQFLEELENVVHPEASPVEKLRAFLALHIKFETSPHSLAGVSNFEMKNLSKKYLELYIRKRYEYEKLIMRTLEEGIEKGYFRKSDRKMTVLFILGLVNSVSLWYKEDGPLSIDQVIEEVWQFVEFSLRVSPKIVNPN